jgi:hypothetical protein
VVLLGLVVWLWSGTQGVRAADVAPEPLVKAEFMERITRFVDWPDESFTSDDAPFTLCVMGDHPFGDYLAKMAKERKIQGRRIQLLRIGEVGRVGTCHLLFVSRSEDKRLDKILAATGDRPILTISDSTGFGARGVLVNFYRDGDNLRFEINVRAVDRSGLHFSSKILRLARLLGKRP